MPRQEHIASHEARLEVAPAGSDIPPRPHPRINSHLIESGLTHVLAPRPSDEPVFILDQQSGREVDRAALNEFGIPTLLLMENAAVWLAAFAAAIITETTTPGAVIVAGKGSNGGDGLAMARHLVNRGWNVAIVLAAAPESYAGDAAVNLRICQKMGLNMILAAENGVEAALKPGHTHDPPTSPERERAGPGNPATNPLPDGRGSFILDNAFALALKRAADAVGNVSILVDALLGTGLSGPLRGDVAALIRGINQIGASGVPVLAVDIPSGLNADTGEPSPLAAENTSDNEPGKLAVCADVTVTLAGIKPGFLELAAQRYVGELLVADIGVPPMLVRRLGKRLESTGRPGSGGGGADAARTARHPLPYRPGEPQQPKHR